ncbi:hypothetical protein JTB14_037420 [Gonioctena quinquepunctata]|nr:hypothetical protein JTB14_037420 [Gonioctena quinquepunctata]
MKAMYPIQNDSKERKKEYTAYSFNRLINLEADPIGANQSFTKRHPLLNRGNQLDGNVVKLIKTKPCYLGEISGTGEPASLREETHPDWVPSINMGYEINHGNSHVCDGYKRLQVFHMDMVVC